MQSPRIFPQLIREVCEEQGWGLDAFSQDWILQISDNKKILSIYGYKWGVNNGAAQLIADDKSAASQVLANSGVGHIPHTLFLNPNYNQHWQPDVGVEQHIRTTLERQSFPLVIKPKNGTIGSHVYKVHTLEEAEKIIHKLFSLNQDVVVAPFVVSDYEYRCIVLDGQVVLVHSKEPPKVTGDGKSTVKEILQTRDPIGNESILLATLSPAVLDQVIPDEMTQVVSWKHNLSKGATARYEPEPDQELTTLAMQAATALGLVLCSVDMLYDASQGQWKVLEVNSGVSLNKCLPYIADGREKAKEIYKKAIQLYFDK